MMEADGEQGQHGLDLDSVEKERLSQSVRNPLQDTDGIAAAANRRQCPI